MKLWKRLFNKTPNSPRDPNPPKNDNDNGSRGASDQQQQQQQQSTTSQSDAQKEQQKQTASQKTSSSSKQESQQNESRSSGGKVKGPKFSFPAKTVKPDMPSDPSNTAFTVVDPELWASRKTEPVEDDGILHVCVFSLLLHFGVFFFHSSFFFLSFCVKTDSPSKVFNEEGC